LDRDGVINKKAPRADYVKKWEEFELLSGSIEAIHFLAKNNYQIFVITNQAGIARGMMTEEDLSKIHENMKKELNKYNITISGIYYCPHGWNDNCECRKPKPGMFYQAAREHHINLKKAIFIGDDERDLQAGEAAGIRSILVTPEKNLLKVVTDLIEGNIK
ncbi:MAG: D-glycero-alpha-D-manno-heptose-1,7-bisphosphate 7-phosphatase, partial [Candidatus Hodarchaeota archaeon]